MSYAINRKELSAQPVLVARRRVKLSEIGSALAEILPSVFKHAQQTGAAIAGQPFTRYLEWGPGLVTIEAGIPVVPSGNDSHDGKSASGESEIVAACLPGGPVATVTHCGPYEKLAEVHAAIQQWIEAQGLLAAGPPWETYTTDPADYPDPLDWKTDVFWPLTR
jgi:effector-binding domain-containing protein